jgi:hypothetical protein
MMHQVTDQSHPLHTIEDPNGNPHLSIIDEGNKFTILSHPDWYDIATKRPHSVTIDKKYITELVGILRICRHSDEKQG